MESHPLFIMKQVEFSAAHRLYREDLSEVENRRLYGQCANPYGHGHNYVVEITFKGEVDPKTDMVVHFSELRRYLDELIVIPLDHRHLNHDVPFLKGILPTSENLALVLWNKLTEALANQAYSIYRVRVSSSPRNAVDYYGPRRTPELELPF